MKKEVIIGIIINIFLIGVIGFFIFTNNAENNSQQNLEDSQMIDCGKIENPMCFSNRMQNCLPVTAELIATDGITKIDLIVLGYENEKCHIQRKINDILSFECYFPIGTELTWDLIDQTFENEKGLQTIVDTNCKNV